MAILMIYKIPGYAEIKPFAFIHTGTVIVALVVCIIAAVTSKSDTAYNS